MKATGRRRIRRAALPRSDRGRRRESKTCVKWHPVNISFARKRNTSSICSQCQIGPPRDVDSHDPWLAQPFPAGETLPCGRPEIRVGGLLQKVLKGHSFVGHRRFLGCVGVRNPTIPVIRRWPPQAARSLRRYGSALRERLARAELHHQSGHGRRSPGVPCRSLAAEGYGVKYYLITRLRQLESASRTKQEQVGLQGVRRWRAIGSNSRKASARPLSTKPTEPKSNAMRRSSHGVGRTASSVRIAAAGSIASSGAERGDCSSVTRAANRRPSGRERFSPRASCRCASGSRRSIRSRNPRRAFPASNWLAGSASPRRRRG